MQKLPVILAVGFIFGCASEGSLTGSTDSMQGTVSMQLENATTGEKVVLENVLPADATVEQTNAVRDKAIEELGWNKGIKATGKPTPVDPPEGNGCGSSRPCGPLTFEWGKGYSCGGSSASCSCNVVCG